jgi:hypothetical protein
VSRVVTESVYQVESSGALLKRGSKTAARGSRVSRNVVLLGLTSLFTDVSSEMVATILPVYVFFALGGSPLQFGIIDGIYQGASALLRVAGGFVADRWRRYKEVAAAGYGISAACKLGLLAVGGAAGLGAVVLVDRAGKGLRTAPRDALISLSSSQAGLGAAFGVHRALDTAGAMLGPLVAFGILLLAPLMFDAVFIVSFCFALIGLAILVLFVQNRPPTAMPESKAPVSARAAARLLAEPRFRTLVVAGAVLGLTTMSDGFLYLGLQARLDFDLSLFPLLFVGTALAYMVLAVPVGRLADRIGRAKVFIAGYGLLLAVYTSLLLPSLGLPALALYLLLFGAYYAATDGVLMALASAVLPAELRASGLALLVTATSLARLVAAIVFGGLWTWFGVQTAVVTFAGALTVAATAAAVMLARTTQT